LNLSLNRIGDDGAEIIAEELSKLKQLKDFSLNLRINSITDKGAG
jgi:hypothetical protein